MKHPLQTADAAHRRDLPPRNACAVVLAGGRGTRIAHLRPGIPKPFVEAAGAPFIHWVLAHLARQGVAQAVVSLGHLADVGRASLALRTIPGMHVTTVEEQQPLGTAGAMLFAADSMLDADPIILLNGDSLVLADYAPLWDILRDDSVDGALLGVSMTDASRYGRLEVNADGSLSAFREKQPGAGLINAGVYVLKRRLLANVERGKALSMETELIPELLSAGARWMVHAVDAPFIDIGTPETIAGATAFIERHFQQGAAA